MKSGIGIDDRRLLLKRIFDSPEFVIEAEFDDQFHDRSGSSNIVDLYKEQRDESPSEYY